MTLEQIKNAVSAGQKVYWSNLAYEVQKDRLGQYHIVCTLNNNCIGLTWADGKTLNGEEHQFFIK